jgi:hypothetical protein
MKNYEKYQFIILAKDNFDSFFTKHFETIRSILHNCFPSHDINNWDTNTLHDYLLQNKNYYILFNNKVIAFATLSLYENYFVSNTIDTYVLTDKNIMTEKSLYPILEGLCRNSNPKYKGMGTYLLKKMSENLSKDFDYLYLVPESEKFKSQSSINCGVNENYKNSQTELIKYYEKNGFKIVDGYYDKDKCIDENNNIKYLYLNVMKKKLK